MGGSGPNRPKPNMRENNEKKIWGRTRGTGQKETPGKKQGHDTLRCNTDPKTTTRRNKKENKGDKQENQQENKSSNETMHPEIAITWGRRKKRNREKQKKIARQEKKQTREKET